MICQKCKKNPATVHMEQMINGDATTYYLCEECAGAYGPASLDGVIKNILDSLINSSFFQSAPGMFASDGVSDARCPACGMGFNEVKNIGKFGCADCYDAFGKVIQTILRGMSGTSVHTGKIPHKSGVKLKYRRELESLREELKHVVAAEEFETAAKIRDMIREMEQRGGA